MRSMINDLNNYHVSLIVGYHIFVVPFEKENSNSLKRFKIKGAKA